MPDKIEITPALLSDLREKAKKATKGNWFPTCDANSAFIVSSVIADKYEELIAKTGENGAADNDAAFIGAANPAVVLALIEYIERLQRWHGRDFEYLKALGAYPPDYEIELGDESFAWHLNRIKKSLETRLEEASQAAEDKRIEIEKLEHKLFLLEKEAAWLASELQSKPRGNTFYTARDWREFARKATGVDHA